MHTPPHPYRQQPTNIPPQRNRRQRIPPLRDITQEIFINVSNGQYIQTNDITPTISYSPVPHTPISNHQEYTPPYQLRKSKSNDALEKTYQEKPALLICSTSNHKWDDACNLCTICYDILCISPTCILSHITQLPCGHRFHENCIHGQWFPIKNTCPLCREEAFQHLPPGKLLGILMDSLTNNRETD